MSAMAFSSPGLRFHSRDGMFAKLDPSCRILPPFSLVSSRCRAFPRKLALARCSSQQQSRVSGLWNLGQIERCLEAIHCALDPKLAAVLVVVACSSFRREGHSYTSQAPVFCSIASEQPAIRAQIHVKINQIPVEMSTPESDISAWLEDLKEEAIQRGVGKDTVLEAFDGVKISPKIMEKDQTQPEKTLTAEDYIKTMVSQSRVSRGVQAFVDNKALLEEISAEYGVPASLLVSIWGIESNYGSYTGSWNVIQALVTLAFDSPEARRRAFFRDEVFHALFILDKAEGPSNAAGLKGSWAGAMGQCQFMPSSFRNYAVDFDRDGRKDIWSSKADIFASIANYLAEHGWEIGGKYAQKVKIPSDMDKSVYGLDIKKNVNRWLEENTITACDGSQLSGDEPVSLVAPDGPSGVAYLVWENFRVVMRYNISILYSLAVYELAEEITAGMTALESKANE
ncbi:uncharacterized protein LOC9649294 isoform X1 [Selaginella moellendorffii]|nr:uncharacterized protein LOC9649294 isoform X1 [Selaginella moellendorffii]|eukprot:XP_002985167.2 uncharacterized protein LOC9649294 isoform X1 [Selaginella moellendorffii]